MQSQGSEPGSARYNPTITAQEPTSTKPKPTGAINLDKELPVHTIYLMDDLDNNKSIDSHEMALLSSSVAKLPSTAQCRQMPTTTFDQESTSVRTEPLQGPLPKVQLPSANNNMAQSVRSLIPNVSSQHQLRHRGQQRQKLAQTPPTEHTRNMQEFGSTKSNGTNTSVQAMRQNLYKTQTQNTPNQNTKRTNNAFNSPNNPNKQHTSFYNKQPLEKPIGSPNHRNFEDVARMLQDITHNACNKIGAILNHGSPNKDSPVSRKRSNTQNTQNNQNQNQNQTDQSSNQTTTTTTTTTTDQHSPNKQYRQTNNNQHHNNNNNNQNHRKQRNQ